MSLLPTLSPPIPPPLFSPAWGVAACSTFTLSYVGGLYLWQATRVGSHAATTPDGRPLDKDHPTVVRARLGVASWSTAISLVGTAALLRYKGAIPDRSPLFATLQASRLLGLPLPSPSLLTSSFLPLSPSLPTFLTTLGKAALYPLLLTATLYCGPLYVSYLDQQLPGQRNFDFTRDVAAKWRTLHGLRNFVVGPITEELVFRSCILATMFYTGASRTQLIFLSPLYFGIAHLHHAWGTYVAGGRTPSALKRGVLQSAFQFIYTSLFGWFANFLFLRTGTVYGPILSHILCNIMGLPSPQDAAEWYPRRRFWIYTSHVIGLVAFAQLVRPLTDPALFGGSLYWS